MCIEITFWYEASRSILGQTPQILRRGAEPNIVYPTARSTELAISIYQIRTFQIFQHGNVGRYILKAIAILLPVLQVGLAQSRVVQGNRVAYFTLANGICERPLFDHTMRLKKPCADNLVVSIGICSGAIMLAATLAKYISIRRKLRSANSGPSLVPTSGGARVSSRRYIFRQGLYDKWLLTRFTLAFAAFWYVHSCHVLEQNS